MTAPPPPPTEGMLLHVGGRTRTDAWTVLDIAPGPHVDLVGDCADLSGLADDSCAVIYASHVLEHLGWDRDLPRALAGFHRILKRSGHLLVSVPDLDMLCRLYIDKAVDADHRWVLMKMMFGGRTDPHDVHQVGLDGDSLGRLLGAAGFARIWRVGPFGLFDDTSNATFAGRPISVNMLAVKD